MISPYRAVSACIALESLLRKLPDPAAQPHRDNHLDSEGDGGADQVGERGRRLECQISSVSGMIAKG